MSQLRPSVARGRLALVVSCTSTKTLPVPPQLRIATLDPHGDRFARWRERLAAVPDKAALRNLYAGPQWAASLRLERDALAAGLTPDLWVLSAGLGLRPATDLAPAYAASFASGPDEVAQSAAGRRLWWEAARTHSHAFAYLQQRYEQVLVVLAPSYFDVVSEDLQCLLTCEAAAVVTSRSGDAVYSSAGLRSALSASAMTLNARAAAMLLHLAEGDPLGSSAVRRRWNDWSGAHTASPAPGRRAATDHEVTAFIKSGYSNPRRSRTALLASFRAQGRACEQSRFQRLYEGVEASNP